VFSGPVQHCRTATPANLVPLSCRALPKMLTVVHLIKKFPASYGASVFLILLSRARNFPLSLATIYQTVPSLPVSLIPIVTISHLRLDLPSGLFPSDCPPALSIPLSSPHSFSTSPLSYHPCTNS